MPKVRNNGNALPPLRVRPSAVEKTGTEVCPPGPAAQVKVSLARCSHWRAAVQEPGSQIVRGRTVSREGSARRRVPSHRGPQRRHADVPRGRTHTAVKGRAALPTNLAVSFVTHLEKTDHDKGN